MPCQTDEDALSAALTMICHAATRATREGAFPGDEPLDAQGVAKAASLSAALRRYDQAWSSPALRARQTAAALALDPLIDPDLRELDYGRWTGRSLAELESEGVGQWLSDADAAPHGGESIRSLLRRTARWLGRVATAEGRVVAVTHASVMRAAVVTVLEAPPGSFWRIEIAPLGQLRLRAKTGRWTLLTMK